MTFNPGLDDNKSNLCFAFQSRDRYVTKKTTVVKYVAGNYHIYLFQGCLYFHDTLSVGFNHLF